MDGDSILFWVIDAKVKRAIFLQSKENRVHSVGSCRFNHLLSNHLASFWRGERPGRRPWKIQGGMDLPDLVVS